MKNLTLIHSVLFPKRLCFLDINGTETIMLSLILFLKGTPKNNLKIKTFDLLFSQNHETSMAQIQWHLFLKTTTHLLR